MPGESVGGSGGNNKRLSGVAVWCGSSFNAVLIAFLLSSFDPPVRLDFVSSQLARFERASVGCKAYQYLFAVAHAGRRGGRAKVALIYFEGAKDRRAIYRGLIGLRMLAVKGSGWPQVDVRQSP